jgi:carboxymethylenebutenolidase
VTAIKIDTPDGPIDALMSIPDGQGPWPGVVVVHDAFGYGPDNESTSARIAAADLSPSRRTCIRAAAWSDASPG